MFINTPLFRRIELQVLMDLTAWALRQPSKRVWTLPADEALHHYAEFTSSHLRQGTDAEQLQRMNDAAYRMGRLLRCLLLIRKRSAAERVVEALYRNIGIRMTMKTPGRLCFGSCSFSGYYTPAACLAASALDDGIIRGLTGCDKLVFSQRITEGYKYCLATNT